jgi:DNA-binding MarR family transcriptional regulator
MSKKPTTVAPPAPPRSAGLDGLPVPTEVIELETWLPYRLNILANQMSAPLAAEYSRRFGLTVPEWRCIAILGRFDNISMLEIVKRTAMDKVAVSRAITKLVNDGRVVRLEDEDDRRRNVVYLSKSGWEIYCNVVPFAKRIEATLLGEFSDEERRTLLRYIDRLSAKLRSITDWDKLES